MELLNNLWLGFQTASTLTNLFWCFAGVFLGTAVGVLPGLGPTAAMAMLLPAVVTLSPVTALVMLAGIYYGSQYGGSTTAILVNLPGETSSVVTAIDGYQMARNGQAGQALAAAALSSFFAGTISTLVIALFAPPLTDIALLFQAPEFFSLILLGLIASISLARGSVLFALAMITLGLLLGLVGADVNSGTRRYTFGFFELSEGINFVVLAMGIYGLGEVIANLEKEDDGSGYIKRIGSLMPSRSDLARMAAPMLRGTIIGCGLGVLPGAGASLASFSAYSLERRLAPDKIGKGAIEGVAAPEAANNAAAQISFIPMLTLGLPSNPTMALMIGAMIVQGVQPGPMVMTSQPELFWGVIASMWIGNVMLLVLNLPLIGIWVRMISIPYHFLYPMILAFCCIGVFSLNNSTFGIFVMAIFGPLGYLFKKLDCEPAPMLLGLILGPILEEYLRRALLLSHGDPMVFVHRPISAGLLAAALILLCVVCLPFLQKKRQQIFVEDS